MFYGKEEQVNIDYIGHIFYMCILLTSGNSVKGHAGSRTQPNFNLISTVQSPHHQHHSTQSHSSIPDSMVTTHRDNDVGTGAVVSEHREHVSEIAGHDCNTGKGGHQKEQVRPLYLIGS